MSLSQEVSFLILKFSDSLPDDTSSVATILKSGIEFFELWISRIGGLVAFVGAIKFALAIKTEDERELMLSILIMVSGFMVMEAVGDFDLFSIPNTYSKAAADAEFEKILKFIGKWTRRVGALGLFAGSIGFGLAIKDNNANTKVNALRGLVAGATAMAVSGLLHTFV